MDQKYSGITYVAFKCSGADPDPTLKRTAPCGSGFQGLDPYPDFDPQQKKKKMDPTGSKSASLLLRSSVYIFQLYSMFTLLFENV